jgi:hypothetical protein
VTEHIPFTVKFSTAIDERCDANKIKIAAEVVVIEDRACPGQLDGLDCVCRGNPGGRRDTAQRCQRRCCHRHCHCRYRQPHFVTCQRNRPVDSNRFELFGQGAREEYRCEHSQKVSVTHLRQREVQYPKQHYDSQPWQRHAAVRRKAKGAEHDRFKRTEMGKILRAPLGDGRQGCAQGDCAERHQNHFGSVRVQACGA